MIHSHVNELFNFLEIINKLWFILSGRLQDPGGIGVNAGMRSQGDFVKQSRHCQAKRVEIAEPPTLDVKQKKYIRRFAISLHLSVNYLDHSR